MVQHAITVYGIPNCDTVKKSRAWLAQHGVEFAFFDFKKHGVPSDHLQRWVDAAGWDALLNRRGSTWRKLDASAQAAVADAASAQALLQAHPSAIKRPVIEWGDAADAVTVGFVPDDWLARMAAGRD